MMPEVRVAAHYRWPRHRALQHARRLAIPLAAVALLGLLTACSSMFGDLPQAVGGLPAEAPARPANSAAFPEVHNMPPDRRAPVMTETEQKQAESDLVAARDKQQRTSAALAKEDQADGTTTVAAPPNPAAKPRKKNAKPADPAGTGRNP